MSTGATLEDLEVLHTLREAYAPDRGDVRWHNAAENSLGFGLLHYALVRNLRPDQALVIGSRYGFVPACIALALKANVNGRLHFVDANYDDKNDGYGKSFGGVAHWSKPAAEVFATLSLHEWIDVFIERTDSFFSRARSKYGYIYLDGNHSYEGVKYDCEEALKHLLPDGIMSFHDAVVDRGYGRKIAESAGFGVKDYLASVFPHALIVNRWPGLALIQPRIAELTPP